MRRLIPSALLTLLALTGVGRADPIPVGTELSLLIDVSGSVDSTEFALQRGGYVNAFRDPVIQALIAAKPGGVAANLVYWSSSNQQFEAVPWTVVTDAASANAFADAVLASARPFSGLTAPGSALDFAVPMFETNNFAGARKVIDVSGDGTENDGESTVAARNRAVAAGITVNGLAIGGPSIETFYRDNVIGGTDSFAIGVDTFNEFDAAINRKLANEIVAPPVDPNPVPAPAGLVLLLVAAAGLIARKRFARKPAAADATEPTEPAAA